MNDTDIASMIHQWFSSSDHHKNLGTLSDHIDSAIDAINGPLTRTEYAWQHWNECEQLSPRMTSFSDMMDLCKYAEWCADTELGYTKDPFSGVPRLVITFGAPA